MGSLTGKNNWQVCVTRSEIKRKKNMDCSTYVYLEIFLQQHLNPQVRDRLNMKSDARLLFSVHREQREAEKEGAELLSPLIL